MRHSARALLATALLLLLLPPSHAEAPDCQPGLPPQCDTGGVSVQVIVSGLVTDPRGAGLALATVGSNFEMVETNSAGRYTIRAMTQGSVTLTAQKQGYEELTISTSATEATTNGIDFALPFTLTATVTPRNFNSTPITLSFVALTSAPALGTRLLVELPGPDLELDYAPTPEDPPGMTRFMASYTTSASLPDQRYYFTACGLDQANLGGCDDNQGLQLTLTTGGSYVLDRALPQVTQTSPVRFRDVLSLSTISATFSDSLSGVDSQSLKIKVDGTPKTPTATGTKVSTSASGLPPGIHLVEVEGKDLAGNLKTDSFEFTLVTITATSANATLREATVPVNSNGAIPPPSQVTFPTPAVDVAEFTETINANTFTGYGDLKRSFSLGAVQVVFNNETGIESSPVTVSVPVSQATHGLATLARSEEPLTATIPAAETAIASITVPVPAGYNTPGSTARLVEKTTALEPPSSGSSQLLNNEIPIGGDPPLISITSQTGVRVTDQDGALGVTPLEGRVEAKYFVNNQPYQVVLDHPAENQNFGGDPTINCGGRPEDDYVDPPIPCIAGGEKLLLNRHYVTVSRQAGFGVYANHWLYRDAAAPNYVAWHQVSAEMRDGCVGNRTLRPKLTSMTTSTSSPLLWDISGEAYSTGGDESGGRMTPTARLDWGEANSIRNTAEYQKDTVSPLPPDSIPGASRGIAWSHGGLGATVEQLILGARYEPGSLPDQTIEVWAHETWMIEVSYAPCP